MRGDVPAGLVHGGHALGIAHQRRRNAEHRRLDVARDKPAPQAPEAGTRAVLEHRLDVRMPSAGPGVRPEHIRQKGLGAFVAVQDVVLAAFLEIDDELHGDARPVRPFRIGGVAAVAFEVTRVICFGHKRVNDIACARDLGVEDLLAPAANDFTDLIDYVDNLAIARVLDALTRKTRPHRQATASRHRLRHGTALASLCSTVRSNKRPHHVKLALQST